MIFVLLTPYDTAVYCNVTLLIYCYLSKSELKVLKGGQLSESLKRDTK